MTIASTINRNDYPGTGAQTTFTYSFRIIEDSDLLVIHTDNAGVDTEWTLGVEYTVTGAGAAAGGTVVVKTTPTDYTPDSDEFISIRRVRPLTQTTDIRNQGSFYPEAHEDAFDHLIMIAQQHQDDIDRSIKLPDSIDFADFNTDLPTTIVGEASVTIITNPAGDGFVVGPTAAAIEGAQAEATAAAASAAAALVSETNAAASAASAAVTVSGLLGNDVSFKVFGDSPVTLTSADKGKVISCDCTGGAIAITLPAIAGLTLTYPFGLVIKKTDSSANKITVTRASTDTIDGATSIEIESQYEGILLFAENSTAPDQWSMIKFGAASAGGGGGALIWNDDGPNAPVYSSEFGNEVYLFEAGLGQTIYTVVKVPSTYVVGRPIALKISQYTPDNFATMLLTSVTTLISTGSSAMSSTTNQYTSTNSALSNSVAYQLRTVSLDLTTKSTDPSPGQINGVAVAPNDLLLVAVSRGTDTSTEHVRLVPGGCETTFR
jgi:hypothetical protein